MLLFDRLGRQPLVIVAGWFVAAALAVMVGVVGIGLVGSGLFAREVAPLSEEDVSRALAGLGESVPPDTPRSPQAVETTETAKTTKETRATRGGTVVADCTHLVSLSPAQGWAVHERGVDEGEFRNSRDRHLRVKVELAGCEQGRPVLEVTEESDD